MGELVSSEHMDEIEEMMVAKTILVGRFSEKHQRYQRPAMDLSYVDPCVQQFPPNLDEKTISCVRCLVMDTVQNANSGHPGSAISMAPVLCTLYSRALNYDPETPQWPNRDRMVLSAGHLSALLYSLLHVAGVKEMQDGVSTGQLAVALDDLKNFRQLGSKCPGHPEYGHTTGVEMTTGPLGQGVASTVGMAMASKQHAAKFNKPDFDLFDYRVVALAGDGCLQEGVSHEAASLAGHLELNNLCWIWDNNEITIEGCTELSTSEDVAQRFLAYGWKVVTVDANDVDALTKAYLDFRREQHRPTLIAVHSQIAYGAPQQGKCCAHGAPLGEAEVAETKRFYQWPWPEEKFKVPEEAIQHFKLQLKRSSQKHDDWEKMLQEYKVQYPAEGKELQGMLDGHLPANWDRFLEDFPVDVKGLATRKSNSICLNQVAEGLPWMLGGSADLASSCLTTLEKSEDFFPSSYGGRNLHFGIREFAMGAAANGLALCGLRPFVSTFLVFSDYMKPAIRNAAMMKLGCIFIFTHDSIGLGEDGPTHQPVEQLCALRSTPELLVMRPADANEVVEMWKVLVPLETTPVAVVVSRQALPTLDRTSEVASAKGLQQGGYILCHEAGMEGPEVILMASGSEVHLMLSAHETLAKEGFRVRSVSMPCMELFKKQSQEYIEMVLPMHCRARVSIEAGTDHSWGRFIGIDGLHIGMDSFGASGSGKDVQRHFGFTALSVVQAAKKVMGA